MEHKTFISRSSGSSREHRLIFDQFEKYRAPEGGGGEPDKEPIGGDLGFLKGEIEQIGAKEAAEEMNRKRQETATRWIDNLGYDGRDHSDLSTINLLKVTRYETNDGHEHFMIYEKYWRKDENRAPEYLGTVVSRGREFSHVEFLNAVVNDVLFERKDKKNPTIQEINDHQSSYPLERRQIRVLGDLYTELPDAFSSRRFKIAYETDLTAADLEIGKARGQGNFGALGVGIYLKDGTYLGDAWENFPTFTEGRHKLPNPSGFWPGNLAREVAEVIIESGNAKLLPEEERKKRLEAEIQEERGR